MLQGTATKKGTGIIIYGDYCDLSLLHQTLHKVCEKPIDDETNSITNTILNFAYEVRKADSGNRLTEILTFDGVNEVEYFGFEYLWTDLLITLNALRYQAGYIATDELDQANFYLLEHVTRRALEQYDPQGASYLKNYINQPIDIHQPLLQQINQYINILYLKKKPSKTRFRNIHKYFSQYFSPWTNEFKSFKRMVESQAEHLNCKPEELTFGDENYPKEIVW